jgi:hypothetical protein
MNDYEQEWRQYKLLRNCAIAFYLSIIFAPLWAPSLAEIPRISPRFSVAFWMILFVFVEVRLICWRCPRCRQWYFVSMKQGPPSLILKAWYEVILIKRCVQCGLPKYAGSPANETVRENPSKVQR